MNIIFFTLEPEEDKLNTSKTTEIETLEGEKLLCSMFCKKKWNKTGQFKKTFRYFSKKCVRENTFYIPPWKIFACRTKYCSLDESTKNIPNFKWNVRQSITKHYSSCYLNEYNYLIFVYWIFFLKLFLIIQMIIEFSWNICTLVDRLFCFQNFLFKYSHKLSTRY